MNIKTFKAVIACLTFVVSSFANASLITIESYDIENTQASGFGAWAHTYNGNIIQDGSTYDYTNGSGTLNDGAIGIGTHSTQLFSSFDQTLITIFFSRVRKYNRL